MTLWIAILLACAIAFGLKLAGYLVPLSILETPWVSRVTTLLPVALLASLVVTQALLTSSGAASIDARAAGVGVAIVALALRAPFLVVVLLAAVTAALIRALAG